MKVLLIQNKFDLTPTYPLSLLIRIVLNGPNHCAILDEDTNIVYEMVGGGLIDTPYDKWLVKTNRIVYVLEPKSTWIIIKERFKYGALDLIQHVLMLFRKNVLKTGNTWNGRDGVPKKYEGVICSEYVAMCLGLDSPHIYTPKSFLYIDSLKLVKVFRTKKKM